MHVASLIEGSETSARDFKSLHFFKISDQLKSQISGILDHVTTSV